MKGMIISVVLYTIVHQHHCRQPEPVVPVVILLLPYSKTQLKFLRFIGGSWNKASGNIAYVVSPEPRNICL